MEKLYYQTDLNSCKECTEYLARKEVSETGKTERVERWRKAKSRRNTLSRFRNQVIRVVYQRLAFQQAKEKGADRVSNHIESMSSGTIFQDCNTAPITAHHSL